MAAVTVTRRELYDLVWAKPIRDVAAELGISDVGLAKVCERHRVPRPEQGYWNKINAGKPARKSIFVDVDDPALNRVVISGALSQIPTEVRTQLDRSRAQRRAREAAIDQSTAAKTPFEQPNSLHAAILSTAHALRRNKPDMFGTVRTSGAGICKIEISPASIERVVGFLDKLMRELEQSGLAIHADDKGILVGREPDAVAFGIKERTRRQKHEPTAAELEAEAKREKQKQRYWSDPRRYPAPENLFEKSYPEFDTIQTSALAFEIDGYDTGMRHSWADGKVQSIESMLMSIVDGINAILTLRRIEREKREERERAWNELCRRRGLAQKRKERDHHRLRYWRKIARSQREIESLKTWLSETALKKDASAAHVQRMMGWVENRLKMLEESVSIETVDQTLAKFSLFPVEDDLIDPLGDPPAEPRYSWQV